jgi:hypothetical protein
VFGDPCGSTGQNQLIVILFSRAAESDPKLCLDRRRRCNATQHSKHSVDGILHALPAFVHDVDTLRSQVTHLKTIISLRDCHVDLVRTHVGPNGMR